MKNTYIRLGGSSADRRKRFRAILGSNPGAAKYKPKGKKLATGVRIPA